MQQSTSSFTLSEQIYQLERGAVRNFTVFVYIRVSNTNNGE